MSKNKHGRPPPLQMPLRTIATSNTLQQSAGLTHLGFCKMNSPMTNLAHNLSELSTGRGTPRRKLSLSSIDTPTSSCHPTPERMSSSESGCFVDSPTPLDSPTLEMSMQRFAKNAKPDIPAEAFTKKKTIAFRRIHSMPLPMMRLSPVDFLSADDKENSLDDDHGVDTDDLHTEAVKPRFYHDENSSQDSGVGLERDRDDIGFQFAAPVGLPPRHKMKIICEDTCSPLKYSPIKDDSPSSFRMRSNSAPVTGLDFSSANIVPPSPSDDLGSPLKFNPLTSHDVEEETDDGFLDCLDSEVAQLSDGSSPVSDTMASLFSAPVLNEDPLTTEAVEPESPVIRRSTQRLFQRSQSMDVRKYSNKRDPPRDDSTPVQNKRRRSIRPSASAESMSPDSSSQASESSVTSIAKPKLLRCMSDTEAVIKSALSRSANEDLIGDCSKPYCLPTCKTGKHQDLKHIDRETMSRVLNHEFDHVIEQAIIVDCRYPYEYDGGHIQGADNIYTKDGILEKFMKIPIASNTDKRTVVIFHCEFSSERGPNLLRFLRKNDRDANTECYPALHYPELYLLSGGYKQFFETQKEHCEPMTYKPMLHEDHTHDLRHFRAKSKSWAGEKSSRYRPLKF